MTRYWDHTEQERAKLTVEQVEKLLAYELMEQGVLMVEPLKVEAVQTITLPARRVFMLVENKQHLGGTNLGIAFDTIEQAESARDAIRYIHESPWNGTAHVRPARSITVVSEEIPDEAAVTAQKAALDEQRRRESTNAEAKRRHDEECAKVAKATENVWGDWRSCREAEAHNQKIRDTFAEYLRLTDGNEALARTFLVKAFPPDEIEAALGPTPPGCCDREAA